MHHAIKMSYQTNVTNATAVIVMFMPFSSSITVTIVLHLVTYLLKMILHWETCISFSQHVENVFFQCQVLPKRDHIHITLGNITLKKSFYTGQHALPLVSMWNIS